MNYILFFLVLLGPRRPESVLCTEKGIFVSDIGEFGSFPDGKIFIFKGDSVKVYADSLMDPKGLAYFGGKLYVADKDRIWEITDSTRTICVAPDSFPTRPEFLNDLAVDSAGNLYVSDTWKGVVFKIDTTGRTSVFAEVPNPNGLAWQDEKLYCVSFTKPGGLYLIKNGSVSHIFSSEDINGADGLAIRKGRAYISGYNSGKVIEVILEDKRAINPKVIRESLTTPADICLSATGDTLYIPLLQKGKIVTVELKK